MLMSYTLPRRVLSRPVVSNLSRYRSSNGRDLGTLCRTCAHDLDYSVTRLAPRRRTCEKCGARN
jgi:hypothetical protein